LEKLGILELLAALSIKKATSENTQIISEVKNLPKKALSRDACDWISYSDQLNPFKSIKGKFERNLLLL
jgi:hypothetical protein